MVTAQKPEGPRREGFWKSSSEPDLPVPEPRKSKWEGQAEFVRALHAVEGKACCVAYRGSSTCRVCSQRNGNEEFSYRNWTWPSGLIHYVRFHNVRPSKPFFNFIIKHGSK